MSRRTEANRRAWDQRRAAWSPLVTDDGFGPHAIVIDEATGCHLWQGNMNGPEPRAGYRGTIIKPRLLAFERAFGPVPADHKLRPTCGRSRCIAPAHLEPVPRRKPAYVPRPRRPHDTALRRELAPILPAERPSHISERDWAALCGVVAGKTYAEVGAELGVSRQRVHQLVERARKKPRS